MEKNAKLKADLKLAESIRAKAESNLEAANGDFSEAEKVVEQSQQFASELQNRLAESVRAEKEATHKYESVLARQRAAESSLRSGSFEREVMVLHERSEQNESVIAELKGELAQVVADRETAQKTKRHAEEALQRGMRAVTKEAETAQRAMRGKHIVLQNTLQKTKGEVDGYRKMLGDANLNVFSTKAAYMRLENEHDKVLKSHGKLESELVFRDYAINRLRDQLGVAGDAAVGRGKGKGVILPTHDDVRVLKEQVAKWKSRALANREELQRYKATFMKAQVELVATRQRSEV